MASVSSSRLGFNGGCSQVARWGVAPSSCFLAFVLAPGDIIKVECFSPWLLQHLASFGSCEANVTKEPLHAWTSWWLASLVAPPSRIRHPSSAYCCKPGPACARRCHSRCGWPGIACTSSTARLSGPLARSLCVRP